jgi:tRNA (cytidine/uridine-2'-O-)-methyltransferase
MPYASAVFHIILFEPEIPPNTGNIIRLCANTGCSLHLVGPLGFKLGRPSVKRAGLDYAELAPVSTWPDMKQCLRAVDPARLFAIETAGETDYSHARFQPQDAFLFGPETRGLPPEVLSPIARSHRLCIPMRPGNRSLNLSNAVAVVVYEAWRQNEFRAPPPPA